MKGNGVLIGCMDVWNSEKPLWKFLKRVRKIKKLRNKENCDD